MPPPGPNLMSRVTCPRGLFGPPGPGWSQIGAPSPQDSTPIPPSGDAQPCVRSYRPHRGTQPGAIPRRQASGERSANYREERVVVSHVTEVADGVHRLTNGVANF